MKRRTIIILGILITFCFIILILLQTYYLNRMRAMSAAQLESSVERALSTVAQQMEHENAYAIISNTLGIIDTSSIGKYEQIPHYAQRQFDDLFGTEQTQNKRSNFVNANKRIFEKIRLRYNHRRNVVEDVISDVMRLSEDSGAVRTRANYRHADTYMYSALRNNGIMLAYHFKITDAKGNELYHSPDYEEERDAVIYVHALYTDESPENIRYLRIHFPDRNEYLLDTMMFAIPVILFTIMLSIVCLYVILKIAQQKKISEMKSDFISNMTHELKTPISSISLAAQMLQDPAVMSIPSLADKAISVIREEIKRLQFQVEKVLQMSLFERNAAKFNQKVISVNDLIKTVIETFRLRVEQLGGSIDLILDTTDDNVLLDEMHFSNVLFNIMDNAVKYRRVDEPIHLIIKTYNTNSQISISIHDNGIGISRENKQRIFERFYRVSTGNKHDIKGFGLGLAYVKKIIDEHKGTIGVESNVNEGSTFTITLPTANEE